MLSKWANDLMGIIEIQDLRFTYPVGTKPAFEDINLKIDRGELVLITGPSGCGKTSICRCLNGLIPHFYGGKLEGELTVSGLKVSQHPISEMAQHVGFVFQNPENQLFALSVEKDVAFGLENLGVSRKEIREKVDWALKTTGIYKLRNRSPHELSGGQKQRVAIASVLAMEPEVVVLDEPTSFLDPMGAQEIFGVINRMNKTLGTTIILVEHRLDLASKYASRIIVMDKGRISLEGNPKDVLRSEKIRLIGVGIPKAMSLYLLLKSKGLDLSIVPLTADEVSRAIIRMMNK